MLLYYQIYRVAHPFCGFYFQYRGTLSGGSEVVLGVLLVMAHVMILICPFLIIGMLGLKALPQTLQNRLQAYFEEQVNEEAFHSTTSAAAKADPATIELQELDSEAPTPAPSGRY